MRIGVYQSDVAGLSVEQKLARLEQVLAGTELDLLLCPELYCTGYNVAAQLHELAESASGATARVVKSIATKHNTAIVYGYSEAADNCIYNSAACIDSTGTTLANHRKLLLPPGFEQDYFSAGVQMSYFDLCGMRCCILICYDAEFPESVRCAAEAGAQVILIPTALVQEWPVVAHKLIPTRAFENGVWVAYANHAGSENGISYLGASCIVDPGGYDVARAGDDDQLLQATLDIARVAAAQQRLGYVHNAKSLRNKLHG